MSIGKAIISGGGTGGHIYPALSIADEIRRRNPYAEILFVGALGRMEMEKVPAAGYKIIGLPIMGFPRKPGIKTVTFLVKLLKSAAIARRIVKDFKPEIAIGVGGYASGPLLRAAATNKVPCLIQEQNSYAGMTNKILARKVKKICVAYDNMERYFPAEKIVFTGNPVRKDLKGQLPDKTDALKHFEISSGKKVVLVIGGSLGARTVNQAVTLNLNKIAESEYEFIWQTGSLYYNQIQSDLKDKNTGNLKVYKYLDRMDFAYAAADLIISRAGAGTISELCLVGKPVILVPSPNVAEDHQTRNALSLVAAGAARMLRDNEIREKLLTETNSILNDSEECLKLSENIKKLAKPFATEDIVNEAEKLLTI